jgi:hypothetical protein
VEFHLERGLRLDIETEHKSLYKWSINEIDAKGQQVGRDQIPWSWTLYFTATSCVLDDSIDIDVKPQMQTEETTAAEREIVQRRVIRVALRPGHPRDDGYSTTYTMFGSDRTIKSFELNIHPLADASKQEYCTAWGTVSYTAEVDFRNETTDDHITFYMFVKPDTFARYATMIAHGSVNGMILSVGRVDGFYSDWSPSISTDQVKVLTGDTDEQKVTLPPGIQSEPPRLGYVGTAKLYINQRLDFGTRAPEFEAVDEIAGARVERALSETQTRAAVEPRMLRTLGSLRRAAWFVVCLLALIFVVTLLK